MCQTGLLREVSGCAVILPIVGWLLRLLLLGLLGLLLIGLKVWVPVHALRLRGRLRLSREDLLLCEVLIVGCSIVERSGALRLRRYETTVWSFGIDCGRR